jgi:secreted trypsin-like serine protease
MSRTYLAAVLAGCTSAWKIVYPGEQVDLIRIEASEYPMVFKWPEEGFRCGATMVSDQMALTAAHCVTAAWDSSDPNLTVRLSDGETYGIREFRTNECWDFGFGGPYSADIAIMVLDRPVENAVQGVNYIKTWDAEEMGDVAGREFILAGWGASGEVNDEGDYDESHHNS